MNQDFVVKATPGNARRIVMMARHAKMTVDDAIVELAETGFITDFPPQASARQRAALQFLADANYRGVLLHNDTSEGEYTVLMAARIGALAPVTIVDDGAAARHYHWRKAANDLGLPFNNVSHSEFQPTADSGVLLISEEHILTKPFLKTARKGLLVFNGGGSEIIDGLCHEFPHAIACCSRADLILTLVNMLLLGNPLGVYSKPVSRNFAPLGVSTHLLTEYAPQILP